MVDDETLKDLGEHQKAHLFLGRDFPFWVSVLQCLDGGSGRGEALGREAVDQLPGRYSLFERSSMFEPAAFCSSAAKPSIISGRALNAARTVSRSGHRI